MVVGEVGQVFGYGVDMEDVGVGQQVFFCFFDVELQVVVMVGVDFVVGFQQ